MTAIDLAIIGAGPAGLAAADKAAECGLTVMLLDEQKAPGGQIYRGVLEASERQKQVLGPDYSAGADLARRVAENPRIDYISGAVVWHVGPDRQISFTQGDRPRSIQPAKLLLATGATERPVPVPGWTGPGVLMAGAAQILMKSTGASFSNAVLAGSGPLLYLIAVQMLEAGTPPVAMVETQTRFAHISAALRNVSGLMRGWRAIAKGAAMLRALTAAGVPRYVGASDLQIFDTETGKQVRFETRAGSQSIDCETILLHQGIVPNVQMSRALDLEHLWNAEQKCFHPVCNIWGRSSDSAIYIAGDGAGILGAKAAEYSGALVALDVACSLEKMSPSQRDLEAGPFQAALAKERAIRPFLDAVYAPPDGVLLPEDETIVCRCEEVTAGNLRQLVKLGCAGPNQAKALSRCGMGLCQGRYCGLTVTNLLADAAGTTPDAIGYFRLRSLVKPVPLDELARFVPHARE